ncbi:Viral Gp157 protein [Gammaproteobacteria bacterium]
MAKSQENLMNMTLYELTGQYAEAAETLEDLDLPEEAVRDTLEALETEIAVKAQNIGALILNMEAEASKIETAEKRLADKRRALKNRTKWIRDYLFSGMQTAGLTKLKSPNGLFILSIRKNPPSVTIDDQSLIPDRFIRTITEVSVDKAALREELKIREVPGARLEVGERLEIR